MADFEEALRAFAAEVATVASDSGSASFSAPSFSSFPSISSAPLPTRPVPDSKIYEFSAPPVLRKVTVIFLPLCSLSLVITALIVVVSFIRNQSLKSRLP